MYIPLYYKIYKNNYEIHRSPCHEKRPSCEMVRHARGVYAASQHLAMLYFPPPCPSSSFIRGILCPQSIPISSGMRVALALRLGAVTAVLFVVVMEREHGC